MRKINFIIVFGNMSKINLLDSYKRAMSSLYHTGRFLHAASSCCFELAPRVALDNLSFATDLGVKYEGIIFDRLCTKYYSIPGGAKPGKNIWKIRGSEKHC